MTIDVYYSLISPPARAVLVAAKYLGIAANLKEINLFAGETRTAEYLKLNPSHTVPTLDDNGFVLFESRAILQYLANKYAPKSSIYPKDAVARAGVDKVLFYDASAFFPAIRGVLIPRLLQKVDPPQQAVEDLKEKVEILEALLGDQRFFAGENPTIADISLAMSLPILKILYPSLISPRLQAWFDRINRDVPAVEEFNEQIDYAPFFKKQ